MSYIASTLASPDRPSATAIPPNHLQCCRFCLRPPDSQLQPQSTTVRRISADQLPYTDIPQLFETVTAIKLDISARYSELLCSRCETQMRNAAQVRAEFVRVARQWKTILAEVTVEETGGDGCHILKTERMDDLLDAAAGAGAAAGFLGDDGPKLFELDELVEPEMAGKRGREARKDVGSADDDSADDRGGADNDDDDDDDNDVEDVEEEEESEEEAGSSAASDEGDEWDEEDELPVKRTARTTPATEQTTGKRGPGRPRKSDQSAAGSSPPRPSKYTKKRLAAPLGCDICGAQLTTRHLLIRHMRTHQSNPSSTCHICGKTNLKRLAQHMRDHRKTDRYKCAHCPRSFCRLAMKQQHERQHTGERPYICEVCAYTFTSPAALKRHSRRHTDQLTTLSTNGQVIPNPLPRQQAMRARYLPDRPMPKLPPRGGVRLECPLCHNTYVNRSSLQPHMKLQHGPEGLVAWKRVLETTCLVCAERFECPLALRSHKLEHQRHQCEICKRRFQSRVTLELHVQKHSKKERRYKCEICEAQYPCSFTLRTHHRRAHTDERPYRCAQCPLGFVERWELNSHMKKQHTFLKSLRPHQCKQCAETFRTVDSLRVHMEKHTGRFRYQCGICLRNQHSGPLLVQHMQSYHPVEWRRDEEEKEQMGREQERQERLEMEVGQQEQQQQHQQLQQFGELEQMVVVAGGKEQQQQQQIEGRQLVD